MSHRAAPLLCLLLLIAGASLARPDDGPALTADTGWQRLDDHDGVALYSRARVGVSFSEFKGTGLIPAPPALVEKVLASVTDYPEFMPYVIESRVVSHDGDFSFTYQRLNMPFVANRDYTVRVEHGIIRDALGQTTYRDTWQTANDAGPAERHGTVRVKVNEGSWVLEPAGADGKSTRGTYQIFTDSGGVIPAFIANRASQIVIPRLFEAIRKQVRDPKYEGIAN